MTPKQKLTASLKRRLNDEIAPQNPVKFLAEESVDWDWITEQAISTLYLFTRTGRGRNKKITLMVEVISTIGNVVRKKLKLKRDSALAAKAGAFILYSFEECELIKVELSKAQNGHATYVITVVNEDTLTDLWNSLDSKHSEKLPSIIPYAPWTSTKHECGAIMVKTESKDVLKILTPETHPLVFKCINKAQENGWKINNDVFPIYTWALRNKTDAFKEIWDLQNPEARASKVREAKAIGSIAARFAKDTFYHLYYFDFRGRKYPATAYLHEQGADLAKGLLLSAESYRMGEQGFFWLCISIASNWAGDAGRSDGAKTDKIPLNDRVYWTLDNEEIILSYAVNPKVNQGWMSADKPWQFLAACNELLKVRKWEKDGNVLYDYCSHLECFIDGSNNGSQHLTALTRDEVTAPHVNLVPLDLPGDLYKYVADHVWTDIANEVSLLSSAKKTEYDSVIDTLIDIKGQIAVAPMKSDRRKELIDEVIQYKKEHEKQVKACSPAYWIRITDSKHKRKIVKRGVMTLPYGASAYGLGQQVIDDARRHGIAQLMTMEHAWGSYLGRAILSNCKGSLKRPTQLLSIFENAGRVAESEGEFLKWTVPVTNFPVIQHYVEGKVKKINVQYGPAIGERNQSTGYFSNNYQLSVTHPEIPIASRRKQSQGAAPNAIHSLDAAHLTMAVCAADYNVTTIHDSFGCHLGRMADLFVLIREKFVELYESDPLNSLMKDINGDLSGIEVGALDIKQILESEYAFV